MRKIWIVPMVALGLFGSFALWASEQPHIFDAEIVGTWGEWASAVGAVGAITAALWIVQHEQGSEAKREAARRDAEQAAIAARVVVYQDPCFYDSRTGEATTTVWINAFGPDPLRYVRVSAIWPEGEAIIDWADAVEAAFEHPDSWPNPKREQESVATASHIDPGQSGWGRRIRGSSFSPGIRPSTTVRWFDRWGVEWRASPGGLPERVPEADAETLEKAARLAGL